MFFSFALNSPVFAVENLLLLQRFKVILPNITYKLFIIMYGGENYANPNSGLSPGQNNP